MKNNEQKALECLERADYAGFFTHIESSVPQNLSTQFAELRLEFISGTKKFDFSQRLKIFTKTVVNMSKEASDNNFWETLVNLPWQIKVLVGVVVAVLAYLMTIIPPPPPPKTFIVQGMVVNQNNKPIPNEKITVNAVSSETDVDGKFSVSGVVIGKDSKIYFLIHEQPIIKDSSEYDVRGYKVIMTKPLKINLNLKKNEVINNLENDKKIYKPKSIYDTIIINNLYSHHPFSVIFTDKKQDINKNFKIISINFYLKSKKEFPSVNQDCCVIIYERYREINTMDSIIIKSNQNYDAYEKFSLTQKIHFNTNKSIANL